MLPYACHDGSEVHCNCETDSQAQKNALYISDRILNLLTARKQASNIEVSWLQGWDRRLRRAKRLFTLDRKAKGNTSKQLSEAEANELSVLKQEMNSLKKWYQHMRIASCVGLLRPQQLASVGTVLCYYSTAPKFT